MSVGFWNVARSRSKSRFEAVRGDPIVTLTQPVGKGDGCGFVLVDLPFVESGEIGADGLAVVCCEPVPDRSRVSFGVGGVEDEIALQLRGVEEHSKFQVTGHLTMRV